MARFKNAWTERVEDLEGENDDLKVRIKGLRIECDKYHKDLDQIDLWAVEIEGLIKKIRGKI